MADGSHIWRQHCNYRPSDFSELWRDSTE